MSRGQGPDNGESPYSGRAVSGPHPYVDYHAASGGHWMAPESVSNAVYLIWANIAIGFLTLLVSMMLTSDEIDAIIDQALADAGLQQAGVDPADLRTVVYIAAGIGFLIGALINIGLAVKINRGANWARIIYTVLGVLGLLYEVVWLTTPSPGMVKLFTAISMVATAASIYFLFRPDARAYFARR